MNGMNLMAYPNDFFWLWSLVLWAITEILVLLRISNGKCT